MQSMHIGQKFQCPECEYQATQKDNLVSHQRSVHMGEKFQCPECDHKATRKGDLVPISDLYIWVKGFHAQSVIIRQLGKVAFLDIRKLYIISHAVLLHM